MGGHWAKKVCFPKKKEIISKSHWRSYRSRPVGLVVVLVLVSISSSSSNCRILAILVYLKTKFIIRRRAQARGGGGVENGLIDSAFKNFFFASLKEYAQIIFLFEEVRQLLKMTCRFFNYHFQLSYNNKIIKLSTIIKILPLLQSCQFILLSFQNRKCWKLL